MAQAAGINFFKMIKRPKNLFMFALSVAGAMVIVKTINKRVVAKIPQIGAPISQAIQEGI